MGVAVMREAELWMLVACAWRLFISVVQVSGGHDAGFFYVYASIHYIFIDSSWWREDIGSIMKHIAVSSK